MVAHLFTFADCRWYGEIDLYECFEEEIALHNITPTQTQCTFSVHSFVVVNTNTKNGNFFFYFFLSLSHRQLVKPFQLYPFGKVLQ